MKTIVKLLTGMSIPLTGIMFLPAIGCANKAAPVEEQKLNVIYTRDVHVKSVNILGEAYTNKAMIVNCTFEEGWKQIDPVKTKILNGNKTLTLYTDYEIINFCEIAIKPNVIKDVDLNIVIYSAATTKEWKVAWNETPNNGKVIDGVWYGQPGEKFKTEDIIVTNINGDEVTTRIEFGYGQDKAQLLYLGGAQDITNDFVSKGFTVEDQMIKFKRQTPYLFYINVSDHRYSNNKIPLYMCVGRAPEKIELVKPEQNPKVGESIYLPLHTKVSEGCFKIAKYEVVSSGTTATNPLIDKDGFLTVEAKGDVNVKVTSLYDNTLTGTLKFTFDAAQ